MPKEEMVNRFEEKFEQVKLRAILTASAINRARTKEEKNILYKEVKSLFFIIQNFDNLEKIEFYKWFLQPCECDNEFEIINIENIEADMQSALEVARYNLLIKNPALPYSSILNKPINNLYSVLCYYLDSQASLVDYIKTDDVEEFVIEFLNLFIDCGEYECICDNCLIGDHCKGEECFCRFEPSKCVTRGSKELEECKGCNGCRYCDQHKVDLKSIVENSEQ